MLLTHAKLAREAGKYQVSVQSELAYLEFHESSLNISFEK